MELVRLAQGSLWRHFRGGLYAVVCVAIDEAAKTPQVVYRSCSEGTIWVRPLAAWHEEVERDGYRGPRFSRVEDKDYKGARFSRAEEGR